MYSDGNENDERVIRERMRKVRHEIREAQHARMHAIKDEIKQAEHAKIDALKQAIKFSMTMPSDISPYPPVVGFGSENCMGNMSNSGPRTPEQIMDEIDSYISYLEDLPKEKVAPYEQKLGGIEEHLKQLRGKLTK